MVGVGGGGEREIYGIDGRDQENFRLPGGKESLPSPGKGKT